MDATVGAIHKGALTLNNRVEDWGNKQITENPSSPVAMWRYAKQWKRTEARREIYNKLRGDKKDGQNNDSGEQKKRDSKNGHPGDAGTGSPDDKNTNASGNPSGGVAYRQANHTEGGKPESPEPEERNEKTQTPVEGLEQMPESARDSFGWRPAPEGQSEGQGKEGFEVFGPLDKIPQEARTPSKYEVPMEDGKKQSVYGAWEESPNGPVLREAHWYLQKTRRAFQILRNKDGKVFARKLDVENAAEKQQQADQKTAPQARQNFRPTDILAPETAPGPQPGENRTSRTAHGRVPLRTTQEGTTVQSRPDSGNLRDAPAVRGGPPLAGHDGDEKTTTVRETTVKPKPTQRSRGPVDFGARYSPGNHSSKESDGKTVNETGFAKGERTDEHAAGSYSRAKEDISNPSGQGGQPPVIEKKDPGGAGSESGTS